MLIVRTQQMNVLLAHRRLEKALRHARKFFPGKCTALGTVGLEVTVRSALDRAAYHGFTSLRDALQFVDLVLVFGPGFDDHLPWAREILENRSGERAHFRCTRLYLGALRCLRRNA